MTRSLVIIENCAVATVDERGSEYAVGYVVVSDGRIVQVGPGAAPGVPHDGARVVDGSGCLATPGLVNTHHHLYQWIFRGLAQDATLFEWLTELYPRWARIDEPAVYAAARAGLGWLALSGCTTSADHHYLPSRAAPGICWARPYGPPVSNRRPAGRDPRLDGPRPVGRGTATG